MNKYLVIGNPIDHSLSPTIHNYWIKKNNIKAIYDKERLNSDDLKNLIIKKLKKKVNKEKVQKMYDIMTGLKSKKELEDISFNYEYSRDNLNFYDAMNVPRIKELPMNGVKSIKYESNLNSSKEIRDFSNYNFLK